MLLPTTKRGTRKFHSRKPGPGLVTVFIEHVIMRPLKAYFSRRRMTMASKWMRLPLAVAGLMTGAFKLTG